jgi:hypothetical protein
MTTIPRAENRYVDEDVSGGPLPRDLRTGALMAFSSLAVLLLALLLAAIVTTGRDLGPPMAPGVMGPGGLHGPVV